MATLSLPYGGTYVEATVPDGTPVQRILPAVSPSIASIDDAIRDSLKNPIGCASLAARVRPGSRVTILQDDWTRPTPARLLLPVLLNELNAAGIQDRDITVLIARGTRPLGELGDQLIREKVGADIPARVRVLVHDCDDTANMKFLGITTLGTPLWVNKMVTEADFCIGVGNIVPHIGAGYAGGAKIVLPGAAARLSTEANHRMYNAPGAGLGKVVGNALRQDMEEAARMAGLAMILNTVLDYEDNVAGVFAGDVVEAFRVGVETAGRVYGVTFRRRTNIVVACPGEPYDLDLGDAGKSLFAAEAVAEDRGTVILVSKCPAGAGWPQLKAAMSLPAEEILRQLSSRQITDMAALHSYRQRAMMGWLHIALVSEGIPAEDARQMGFEYYDSVKDALRAAVQRYDKPEVTVIERASIVMPVLTRPAGAV